VISAVAFCPDAPALVPQVGRGLDRELGDVRAACRTAIRRGAGLAERIVVLGSAPVTQRYEANARGSFAGYGVALTVALGTDEDGRVELPLSLAVGAWLLRDALGPDSEATGWSIGREAADLALPADRATMLLVVGDGSARRSEKAPGYLDPRAAQRDERTAQALRSGDADRLHAEPDDAELLVGGSRAWDAAASAVGGGAAWSADLYYEGAPFGVGYFVALWTR
jgi:hypothetical protein